MATIDYPSTIPEPMDGSLQEGALAPWVDDAGSVGIARRRQRFTRELKSFTFVVEANDTQKDAMETFYKTTTSFGTAVFNWTHPTTSQEYEVRFKSRPGIQHATTTNWLLVVSLDEY